MSIGSIAEKCTPGEAPLGHHHQRFVVIEGFQSGQKKDASCSSKVCHNGTVFTFIVVMAILFSFLWRLSDALVAERVTRSLGSCGETAVTVMPGDSLWHIAEQHGVDGCTTDELVRHIVEENNLHDAQLHVGMKLMVPSCAKQ